MNLRVLIISLIVIGLMHIVLVKVIEIKKQNESFIMKLKGGDLKELEEEQKEKSILPGYEYDDLNVVVDRDRLQNPLAIQQEDEDMKKDLLDFVESSSFYDRAESYESVEDREENFTDKYSDEPDFLKLSNDNVIKTEEDKNDELVLLGSDDYEKKSSPIDDKLSLESSILDKQTNQLVYYSQSKGNDKTRTIKKDHWVYKNDKIQNGGEIDNGLFAFDMGESMYAAI